MEQKSHKNAGAILLLKNICYLVQCALNIYIENFLILHHLYIETPSSMQSPKRYFGLNSFVRFLSDFLLLLS